MTKTLSPVSVLGTDMLHQLLDDAKCSDAALAHRIKPLIKWAALLHEVALRERLFGAYSPELAKQMPPTSRPANVTPVFVDDWDDGWKIFLSWLHNYSEEI